MVSQLCVTESLLLCFVRAAGVLQTCGRVWVGRHLSDTFPVKYGLKQGNALLSLLFNFSLEYTIRRVQANQDGLKLYAACQFSVYTGDTLMYWVKAIHTRERNTEALSFASKEISLNL
jgi:hypothetical protein